ncbi:hypothetical protein HQQ81_18065 [Microbacteriaceae bacterium VKM Ac-2854]|nr:hypothetical protein [Microbacteriaceae bacterium VKM Ac-2854]
MSSELVRDVVFTFSYETYTDAVARGMMRPPDQLLTTLMNSPHVGKLLVVNPFRWAPSYTARQLLKKEAHFPSSPELILHTPLRLQKKDPTSIEELDEEYARWDASVARVVERHELVRPVAITTNPVVAGYAPMTWAEHVMFFSRDDWSNSPRFRASWPAFREAYRRVATRGRSVTAVSQEIIDRIAPEGPHAVIPNGVAPQEWSGPVPESPAWLAAIPGPRALHVGTLDDRLDVEGVRTLATARPSLQIILMGPQPDAAWLAPIAELPNVYLRPSVGRRELVATMRNVELCLLAHRHTDLTEAMSPLKLYEYVASGCPVISVDLPPIHGISDRIRIVPTMAEFADVVDEALAAGMATEDERMAFVNGNSWTARHQSVLTMALDLDGHRSGGTRSVSAV